MAESGSESESQQPTEQEAQPTSETQQPQNAGAKEHRKPWDTLFYRLLKHDSKVENDKRRDAEIQRGDVIKHHPAGEGAVDLENPDDPIWDRAKPKE